MHTKLRHGCSSLNYDLFKINLLESPSCRCGYRVENAEHFLLYCTLYDNLRADMINQCQGIEINIDFLLNGNETISFESNKIVFMSVQQFLKRSKRFI